MERKHFLISPERYRIVIREITEGSQPELRFYIMVAVSTTIASLGLVTNSTAVIIGAMLVAPLMTPIFGIALALIRSDAELFGKALVAEIAGVAAAILTGVLIGYFIPAFEPTPEMIVRTEPQLFDLLVAVFSGFAGAYALMDEKISPALPGVAIATAIVPPLANTGLCFAVGQYAAGIGSFLLFFANFLSILLVASAAFWYFGMSGSFAQMSAKVLLRRFSAPVLCFLLVAAFLTGTLLRISQQRHLIETVKTTLNDELLQFPDTSLEKIQFDEQGKEIYVLAEINSSATLTPTQVSRLENGLQEKIDRPTHLVVRSKIATEISPLGSILRLQRRNLDGSFTTEKVHPRVREVKIVDTVIREALSESVETELENVRVYEIAGEKTVVASMYGFVKPAPEDIKDMEMRVREALNNPEVRLVISYAKESLYDSDGTVSFEFSGLLPISNEYRLAAERSVQSIRGALSSETGVEITSINYSEIEGTIVVMVEAVAPETITPDEVRMIEQKAAQQAGVPVSLLLYKKADIIITSDGYKDFSTTASAFFKRRLPAEKKAIRKIIEESNM